MSMDTFFTDRPLLETSIESPGPREMSAHDEATGVIYQRIGRVRPGEGWEIGMLFLNDRRRYFNGLCEWRKAAV